MGITQLFVIIQNQINYLLLDSRQHLVAWNNHRPFYNTWSSWLWLCKPQVACSNFFTHGVTGSDYTFGSLTSHYSFSNFFYFFLFFLLFFSLSIFYQKLQQICSLNKVLINTKC